MLNILVSNLNQSLGRREIAVRKVTERRETVLLQSRRDLLSTELGQKIDTRESFVPAVAYHFYLALPAAFTQPGAQLLAQPCIFLLTLVFRSGLCVLLLLSWEKWSQRVKRGKGGGQNSALG